MRLRIFSLLLLFSGVLLTPFASPRAEADKPPMFTDTMNGYRLKDFGDFAHKWHFVTVRFRKDTNEMRLTYANDSAWKTLSSGKTDYPDGAIFAKIGIASQGDPAFASSFEPAGAVRYQFMVRNAKKYADTSGWGYALFGDDGHVNLADHPDTMPEACNACHKLVKDRNYVFSRVMRLEDGRTVLPEKPDPRALPAHVVFADHHVTSLPLAIQEILPKSTSTIRVLTGELSSKLFQGTLDEIRPTLEGEAIRQKKPAALIDDGNKRFSIIYVDDTPCTAADKKPGLHFKGLMTIPVPVDVPIHPTMPIEYCDLANR